MPTSSDPISIFVILDTTAERQLALERAMRIARMTDCGLHLFACVYEAEQQGSQYDSRKEHKYQVIRDAEERVDAWRRSCREASLHCETEVIWNSHWVDAALRSITRQSRVMVVKSSYDWNRSKVHFGEATDFSLMRYSSAPVLFTHNGDDWPSDRLLACVDVASGEAEHDRLNQLIVDRARFIGDLLNLELHVAACFHDRIKFRTEIVANRFDVQPEQVHLREGPIFDSLQSVSQEISPAMLMLGALARADDRNRLVGSTASRMLDLVETDIVTVI